MSDAIQLTTTSPSEGAITTSRQKLLELAASIKITNQLENEQAVDLLKNVSGLAKKVEEERKKLVEPFNKGVKAINERFKAMAAPLVDADAKIRKAMLDFRAEEQRKANEALEIARKIEAEKQREAERLRLEEEAARASEAPPAQLIAPAVAAVIPTMPVAPVAQIQTTTRGFGGGMASVRKNWVFEVEDIATLAAAYPELVSANAVAINQAIRDGIREIPGVRVFQSETIAVR